MIELSTIPLHRLGEHNMGVFWSFCTGMDLNLGSGCYVLISMFELGLSESMDV